MTIEALEAVARANQHWNASQILAALDEGWSRRGIWLCRGDHAIRIPAGEFRLSEPEIRKVAAGMARAPETHPPGTYNTMLCAHRVVLFATPHAPEPELDAEKLAAKNWRGLVVALGLRPDADLADVQESIRARRSPGAV